MTPYLKQENNYYCGPAVAQMVLARSGIETTQSQLAAELGTSPDVGTTAEALEALLEKHGLLAERRNDATIEDIRAALSIGHLVIVGYIGIDFPHYAIVSDVRGDTVVLRDPFFGAEHKLPLKEFEDAWHDEEPVVYGNRFLITAFPKPTQ